MWNNKLPIRFCGVLTFLLAANAAQLSNFMPIRYYHYPTPQHQLTIPQSAATTTQQRYQQQSASYAQTQQRYVQQQTQQQYYQQYQQNQQQASQQSATSYYQHTQQLPAATATNVAQQFTAPALENAAFTTALTNQGYKYGNGGSGISNSHAASSVSAARALPSSILPLPSSLVEALEAANDIAPKGAIDTTDTSINLKLPLPVNIAPIKVSPLPLDEGVSFNKLANNGVTSYGTVYPQRKRR
ncbi:uncharacterized protein LOC129241884 [Anastrepha obliqua]|uniref:uncharacterized protein LOC129241884 n=1 Tax=Anastrepha obliqua TaxID=95512 RepID=UPI002409475A|nr:uncharacterized protein LOC129241884 [Anastrepha obliqua]